MQPPLRSDPTRSNNREYGNEDIVYFQRYMREYRERENNRYWWNGWMCGVAGVFIGKIIYEFISLVV